MSDFPAKYLDSFLAMLMDPANNIEVLTYSDLNFGGDDDYENYYPGERKIWEESLSSGERDPEKIYVFIQHDVDSAPERTNRLLEFQRKIGLRSNVMIFNRLVNRSLLQRNNELAFLDYGIDLPFYLDLQKQGWVFGYHSNAYEQSKFDVNLAGQVFIEDVRELRSKGLDIEFFCPHGGVRDSEGRSNSYFGMPDEMKGELKWVLNKHTIRFDGSFSDGGFKTRDDWEYLDIRKFLRSWRPGKRYRILFHPQYYDDNFTPFKPMLSCNWYRRMAARKELNYDNWWNIKEIENIPVDYRGNQYILGFPARYSNDIDSNVPIKVRSGRKSTSDLLSGFELFNLRNPGEAIYSMKFESEIALEPPPPYLGSGEEVEYQTEIEVPKHHLFEGEFSIVLRNSNDELSSPINFIVRDLNKQARVGVVHPLYTWQAYNTENGGSFYWGEEFDNGKISISLNRPMPANSAYHTIQSVMPFIVALDNAKIGFKSFCNHDLHNNPELLEGIDVLVIPGHDEYWSHTIRNGVEGFVRNGGHIASFSGNVGWWAINVNGDEIYVNKSHQNDTNEFPSGTGQFKQPWINKPIQTLMGMSYQFAGYPVKRYPYGTYSKGRIGKHDYDNSGDLIILENEHPVFSGLSFEEGDRWGDKEDVLSVEVDGVLLEDNRVAHYRMEGVPREITVLAKALVQCSGGLIDTDGNFGSGVSFQEVGIACETSPFDEGGRVLNFGSIGYYNSIGQGNSVGREIFVNSINYLLDEDSFTQLHRGHRKSEKREHAPLALDNKDEGVILSLKGDGSLVLDSTKSNGLRHTIISSKQIPIERFTGHDSIVIDVDWEIESEISPPATKILVIFEYLDNEGIIVNRNLHAMQSKLIESPVSSRFTDPIDQSDQIESIKIKIYQNNEQKSLVCFNSISVSNVGMDFSFEL
jgi:hypothetical protein